MMNETCCAAVIGGSVSLAVAYVVLRLLPCRFRFGSRHEYAKTLLSLVLPEEEWSKIFKIGGREGDLDFTLTIRDCEHCGRIAQAWIRYKKNLPGVNEPEISRIEGAHFRSKAVKQMKAHDRIMQDRKDVREDLAKQERERQTG